MQTPAKRPLSIRTQIVAGILLVLAMAATYSLTFYPARQRSAMLRDAESRLRSRAEAIALSVAVGLRYEDLYAVSHALKPATADSTIDLAIVFDEHGEVLAEHNPTRRKTDHRALLQLPIGVVTRSKNTLTILTPISTGTETLGTLAAVSSLATAQRAIVRDQLVTLGLLGLISLAAALVGTMIANRIARPLVILQRAADRVAAGAYDVDLPKHGAREVQSLSASFTAMSEQVRSAVDALTGQKAELARSRDEALSAAKTKSLFLATMSHEIRTPMTGVLGMLDLLARTSLNQRQAGFVHGARDSALALLGVIDSILDFSKIDAGKVELEHAEFSIVDVVEDVAELLAERAYRKGLALVCEVDPDLPQVVVGDAARVRQILLNLGGNAVKFTSAGSILLRVRRVAPGSDDVRFEVHDTGVGIAKEALGRLFQPFSQADASTTRRFGGTGLGLSICKHLIELMSGEIRVKSDVGVGTTFVIKLPLPTKQEAVPSSELNGVNVLIVDSHHETRRVMARYLERAGAVTHLVDNCHDGFAHLLECAAANSPVDVVVMDFQMACAAQEGLQRLRSHPGLLRGGLVAATSVIEGDLAVTLNPPCPYVQLSKPVRRSALVGAVRSLASRSVQPGSEQSAEVVPERPFAGTRVLVAEDHPINQAIARELLGQLGCTVELAETGAEALIALTERTFDLVLMDCQMPVMDGFDATRQWREHERSSGENERMTIIALTANAIEGDRDLCLAAGMDDYLSKPYTRDQLQSVLAQWLPTIRQGPALRVSTLKQGTAPVACPIPTHSAAGVDPTLEEAKR